MHRLYENGDISVFWDSEKCFHAKKCVTGCPEAFDVNRKPWIDIGRAPSDKVWQAVSKCPSGGLTCTYNHDVRIVFEEENSRSVALFGDKKVGECSYKEVPEGWEIVRTEVDREFEGRMIAKRLVYALLQEGERRKVKVTASCSYAAKLL